MNQGTISFEAELVTPCKYGENGWQIPAGHYRSFTAGDDPLALHKFRQNEGGQPSHNSLCDLDRLLQTITHIAAALDVNGYHVRQHIALGVKHGNACGAAVGEDEGEVIDKMVKGDERALFGGMVMTNFPINNDLALRLTYGIKPPALRHSEQKRLFDGIVAPHFSDHAIETLARKNGRCRLLENAALKNLDRTSLMGGTKIRQVRGGFLMQPNYTFVLDLIDSAIEWYGDAITIRERLDLLLAWAIGSTSNSNTVTIVKDGQLIGNGVGQQDRVGCCELALKRAGDAGHDLTGAVAYSDSFFPFPDGPERLAMCGVKTILASSGSVNDKKVIEKCEEYGVKLLMIPDSIGRGFFGH